MILLLLKIWIENLLISSLSIIMKLNYFYLLSLSLLPWFDTWLLVWFGFDTWLLADWPIFCNPNCEAIVSAICCCCVVNIIGGGGGGGGGGGFCVTGRVGECAGEYLDGEDDELFTKFGEVIGPKLVL